MSGFDTSALPPVDQASLPASVRGGTEAAKNAYQAGLAFEQILVGELSKELAATSSSSDGSDDASGLMGSDPASSMYSQMLPTALTSSIMGSGGTGIALQLARALDPSLTANAATTQTPAATGDGASAPAVTVPTSGGAAVSPAPAPSVPTAAASAPTAAPASVAPASEGPEGPEAGESGEDGA